MLFLSLNGFADMNLRMEIDFKMKKICMGIFTTFLVITFATGVFINTVCAQKVDKEELSVGIVLSGVNGEREILLKDQFEVLCIKKDIKVRIKNSDNSCKIQRDQIKDLVNSGINVLVIDAVSTRSKELEDSINYAKSKGASIIFLENKVEASANDCSYVGFDSTLVVGDNNKKYNKIVEKTLEVCINLYNGGMNEKVCVANL